MSGRNVEIVIIAVLSLVIAGMSAAAFAVTGYDAALDGDPSGAALAALTAYACGAALPAILSWLWGRF